MRAAELVLVLLVFIRGASPHRGRALFPSASRTKQGTCPQTELVFQRSTRDVHLLFEILLSGMQIGSGSLPLLIPDRELSSLRNVDKLQVICDDVLPKTLPAVRRLVDRLARRRRPWRLSWRDFERTVLTLVYAAQAAARSADPNQREAWSRTLTQLFRAVQEDLGDV